MPPFGATCSIWCGPDVGGKHLNARLFMGWLHQPSLHLLAHSPLHLQQLLTTQAQGIKDSLTLSVLNGKPVRYRCYHGGPLPTATLWLQKTDITVRHKSPDHFVESSGKPKENRRRFQVQGALLLWPHKHSHLVKICVGIRHEHQYSRLFVERQVI